MINVWIDEVDLLNLLMERLEFWTQDKYTLNLYEKHLKDLINGGTFEGIDLDSINTIIDNLYINDTTMMSKEELEESKGLGNDYTILAKDIDNDLYLVRD